MKRKKNIKKQKKKKEEEKKHEDVEYFFLHLLGFERSGFLLGFAFFCVFFFYVAFFNRNHFSIMLLDRNPKMACFICLFYSQDK